MDEGRKFEIILDSIADGVFTIDSNWRIQLFNRAAERITGFSASEAIGRICKDVFLSNLCESNCAIRQALETNCALTNHELVITRKDGRQIPVAVSASILRDDSGEIIGAVETFRDISKLKRLELELQEKYCVGELIGRSQAMRRLFDQMGMLMDNDVTVLITGETGTGKSLIAKTIHDNSLRADKPFVPVNCAALPESLIESELFGHVRGAFTGAITDRPGRFELAAGGTIFLDEVSEIPIHLQAKLLRVIEDKEFERVGSHKPIRVDVRIIAATNRDIRKEVKAGRFREDLFYRLNVVSIMIPPLRDRKEDIPILVKTFIDEFADEFGKKIDGISHQAMDLLLNYDWPGNVRELENAIKSAIVRCRGGLIESVHLPAEVVSSLNHPEILIPQMKRLGPDPLGSAEKTVILKALEETGYHIGRTAELLGISRSTLWRKMRKYGIG